SSKNHTAASSRNWKTAYCRATWLRARVTAGCKWNCKRQTKWFGIFVESPSPHPSLNRNTSFRVNNDLSIVLLCPAMKKALITGITGQDGSYLTELLLSKGYTVFGIIRRSSSFNTGRIDHIYQDPHDPNPKMRLVYGDLNDASSLNKIIRTIAPDEIYNLGAQSHVRVSFDVPEYTGEITGLGTVRPLEAIRESGVKAKFYQASSSEMYGNAPSPQSEVDRKSVV